jgi:hypothetical protein
MALRTHNLPSRLLKNYFGEVDEAMFHGVERPREIIFFILFTEKKRLFRIHLSDDLSRRLYLRTHNLTSGRLK